MSLLLEAAVHGGLLDLVHALTPMSVSVDSDEAPLLLLLLGPAGAVGVYWGLYEYYRNTGKSHSFETETHIESEPPRGNDHKVKRITGTSRSEIQGNNRDKHRKRVNRVR